MFFGSVRESISALWESLDEAAIRELISDREPAYYDLLKVDSDGWVSDPDVPLGRPAYYRRACL